MITIDLTEEISFHSAYIILRNGDIYLKLADREIGPFVTTITKGNILELSTTGCKYIVPANLTYYNDNNDIVK